jgi:hypothetical protein
MIDFEFFLKRADEEVVLIVRSSLAGVSQPVDVNLIVLRTTPDGRNGLEVIRHAPCLHCGTPREHVLRPALLQKMCHRVRTTPDEAA